MARLQMRRSALGRSDVAICVSDYRYVQINAHTNQGSGQKTSTDPAICRVPSGRSRPRVCTEIDHSDCARRCDNCVHLSSMDSACPMTIRATAVLAGWMDWEDVEHHLAAADSVEV